MGDGAAAGGEAAGYDQAIGEAMRARAASPRLRFSNPALEREFRQDYAQRSLRQVRISLAIGGLLYAVFGLLDPWVIPNVAHQAWLIRYALVCPLIAGIMLFSLHQGFARYLQASMVLVGLAAGLGITAMIVLAVPPGNYLYYAGLLLVCTFAWTFMRLRVGPAAIACLSLVALYEIEASFSMPFWIFVNNSFFMISFNIVGLSACYYMERYARADFLQHRIIEQQTAQLGRALEDMQSARAAAEEQARHDDLTGLYNRRHFQDAFERETARSRRTGEPVAAILLDVDHFKRINDSLGHATGDRVLVDLAERIRASVRAVDIPCRYGGEEFAILLPGAGLPQAQAAAERLRAGIEALQIPAGTDGISLTASLGVAVAVPGPDAGVPPLMEWADEALYEAKRAGRNKVVSREPEGKPA